jgi:hypothetical protein
MKTGKICRFLEYALIVDWLFRCDAGTMIALTDSRSDGVGQRGRSTKLTPAVQKVIVDGIAAGVPRKFAAMRAGIDESTFHFWVRKGRRAKRGPHFQFFQSVKKAEADAIARNVALVQKAASKSWQASAWWLERRHPEEFGRKDNLSEGTKGKTSGADTGLAILGQLAALLATRQPQPVGNGSAPGPGDSGSAMDAETGAAGSSVP